MIMRSVSPLDCCKAGHWLYIGDNDLFRVWADEPIDRPWVSRMIWDISMYFVWLACVGEWLTCW